MKQKKSLLLVLGTLTALLDVESFALGTSDVKFSGFVDAFYVYDFSNPKENRRQDFLYNHNRHNEININLALLKMSLDKENYRANIALQTGTYARDNYEQKYKNIHEANIGVSLNSKKNLWLDVGIFASHIGFESAISMNNYTLTRSLVAENTPYYLAGAKLTYTPSNKLEFAFIVCNGWQRIEKVQGNSLPSFGTQIKYAPSDRVSFNWSTFIGTDDPDVTRRMRYLNNFFAEFKVGENINIITGLDIGMQQKTKESSDYNYWYIPTLITKYTINQKYSTALRAEYFHDKNGVLINQRGLGFKTYGLSSNLDYSVTQNALLRVEARWLSSDENVFKNGDSENFIIMTSLALKF